ncbi:MAG: rifamycin-inactivating phosphotransferase [Aquihabitans sp.]
MMNDVVALDAVDASQVAVVGGKAANLGELMRIDGVAVPPGFCVTTAAFDRALAAAAVDGLVDRLATLDADDLGGIAAVAGEIRAAIEAVEVPVDLQTAIAEQVVRAGDLGAWAVRSSATAEDLPTASFAGQQDSFLNVVGADSVVDHVRRCWASLFTDRAVAYRQRHGFDHRTVRMAVVVQRLVEPKAAGILFTADPVSGNRRVATIDAGFGLGEALVSGAVDPDVITVRDGAVVGRTVGAKTVAVRAVPGGGTEEQPVDRDLVAADVLTDAQAVDLVALGRRIEAHLGAPQDIEWCLVDDVGGERFVIVQSRPITTLFPIPANAADGANHVYVSVGHQQMMTDPFTPFGLSFHQMIAGPPMHEAAGRLFVDVTMMLASPETRPAVIDALGTSDPLIGQALEAVAGRDGFLPPPPPVAPPAPPKVREIPLLPADPAIVAELIERSQASVARLEQDIAGRTGSDLLDFIEGDVPELKRVLTDPDSRPVIFAGFGAALRLNDDLLEWLGEKNAVDVLSLSAPGNVTAEMGLALLDVADAIRPHPEVVAFLRAVEDDGFLDRLAAVPGGPEAREAINRFLDEYGMRCVGEIDITRPRWFEQPSALIPAILANVDAFEAGEAERRFEHGRQLAEAKAAEVLDRLRALPDGDAKADETEALIARVRTFAGFREYPKFGYIRRFGIYKRALAAEADRLVDAGVLRERDDAWFFRFEELHDVVRTGIADLDLVDERRAALAAYRTMTPPRVLTSEGEAVAAAYDRSDLPEGSLAGLAVSTGTVEGRARVVLDLADADIEPGDILVTVGTDPSWSPLFVSIAGLVTEVGGLMTHGAVIAREYGLPAVVGVERATELIVDGQRIRVHGTDGFVELLDRPVRRRRPPSR